MIYMENRVDMNSSQKVCLLYFLINLLNTPKNSIVNRIMHALILMHSLHSLFYLA
jgi:hypothetical protein